MKGRKLIALMLALVIQLADCGSAYTADSQSSKSNNAAGGAPRTTADRAAAKPGDPITPSDMELQGIAKPGAVPLKQYFIAFSNGEMGNSYTRTHVDDCEFKFSGGLGGFIPAHDRNMETSRHGIYIAGDVAGIEEASVAIEEGRLAGIAASEALGYIPRKMALELKEKSHRNMEELRSGSHGAVIARLKKEIMGVDTCKISS